LKPYILGGNGQLNSANTQNNRSIQSFILYESFVQESHWSSVRSQ